MTAPDLIIRRFDTSDSLSEGIADQLAHTIVGALAARGAAHIVLTGGRIGTRCLESLRAHPLTAEIPWDGVEFWWSDERYVASDSPDRNDVGAFTALLDYLPISNEQIHSMPSAETGLALPDAAARYESELASSFGSDIAFDVALLGLGEDAHVASLFPHLDAVQLQSPGVVAVSNSPKPPSERLTFTLPLLATSRQVWILASGRGKVDAVRAVTTLDDGSIAPASVVRGSMRTLLFVDNEAAGGLDEVDRASADDEIYEDL